VTFTRQPARIGLAVQSPTRLSPQGRATTLSIAEIPTTFWPSFFFPAIIPERKEVEAYSMNVTPASMILGVSLIRGPNSDINWLYDS
jgi:hypothetical protein